MGRLRPTALPRAEQISVDLPVLLFTLALALGTALVFGLIPLFVSLRANVSHGLKASSKSAGASPGARRVRELLVVAEVGLALVLLVSAGLLVRSFMRVNAIDPGFQPAQVVKLSLELPLIHYRTPGQVRNFTAELLRRFENLPGIERVGGGTELPMAENNDRVFTPEGYAGGVDDEHPRATTVWTIGRYFETLDISLIAGRLLTAQDTATSEGVVVISKRVASRYWPGQSAIGKRLKWGPPQNQRAWLTIVGVVGDAKHGPLDVESLPAIYQPYTQADDARILGLGRSVSFAIRPRGDGSGLAEVLRKTVWSLDDELAVLHLQNMTEAVIQTVAPRRFNTVLLGLFALIALLLSCIGVSGVVAYSVAQRTREIGLRIALGAQRTDVFGLIIRQGMTLVSIGLAVGLLASFLVGRFVASLLFEVSPTDPLTLGLVAMSMALVAFVASCVPAASAMSVDPLVAFRSE